MFDSDARTETPDTVVAFKARETGAEQSSSAYPNPCQPLAFKLAMELVERTEYDAA